MLIVKDRIQIPDDEITWKFSRSSGPGGQNVNKVASRAMLFWDMNKSALPADVKERLGSQQRRRITTEGVLIVSSQQFRDQDRNRQDCLEKLRNMLLEAARPPKKRRPTRPTRGSREARLQAKKHRSARKTARRSSPDHD